jgi:hypothetical protein
MALDTYTSLKTSVATWLHRSDLTAQIPDFISLAEAQFQRTIRNRNMEQRATASATQYMSLPGDYIAMRRLQLTIGSGNQILALLSPEEANFNSATSGQSNGYVLLANQIQLVPSPDSSYTVEIDYYKQIPVLSSTNSTNWLLTAYPDMYLIGALLAAAAHIQDDSRLPMWQSNYTALLADINGTDRQSRFSGSTPYVRAA